MRAVIASRSTIKVRACSTNEKLTEAGRIFRIKRIQSIKDNLNKFLILGATDIKEVGDHLKELDLLHKEAVEGLMSRKVSPNSTEDGLGRDFVNADFKDEDDDTTFI